MQRKVDNYSCSVRDPKSCASDLTLILEVHRVTAGRALRTQQRDWLHVGWLQFLPKDGQENFS